MHLDKYNRVSKGVSKMHHNEFNIDKYFLQINKNFVFIDKQFEKKKLLLEEEENS